MAIINNNVTNVKFLRNGSLFSGHDVALNALSSFQITDEQDGTAILARYSGETASDVKTIVGWVYVNGAIKTITIQDTEGASQDLLDFLGTGVTKNNNATMQLNALSGATFTAGTSSSADTSVEGAKAYAYDLVGTLEYTDTAETGSYVSKVDQVDGIISTTKVALPTVTDTKQAKKVVVSVSEDKGTISNEKGTISSSAETIVLTDNADGGVNFEVNIDNDTIVQDETSKKLKVASAALTQYVGDGKTIEISAADTNNNKTVSTLLTLSSVTPSSTTVKEEYALKNAIGETIGSTIKIYKDSSIVEINYITDPTDVHYQNLEYVYVDASGNTQTEYVDMSALVLEAEFGSGVTFSDGVAHGVVDPTSESFLTVGANGFKIAGVSGLVEDAIEALDANVSGNSTHVTVGVEEVDGIITAVTVSEDNIANANDLAALSAKTITNITSTNSSIDISTANTANNTVEVDVITDASKIKMSGFTTTTGDSLSGIAESDSVTGAFEEVQTVINGVDARIDDLEEGFVSGVSVNGNAVTVSNHVAPISISGATSAMTPTSTEAIVVNTDTTTGAITLGIGTIDCGTY